MRREAEQKLDAERLAMEQEMHLRLKSTVPDTSPQMQAAAIAKERAAAEAEYTLRLQQAVASSETALAAAKRDAAAVLLAEQAAAQERLAKV